MANTNSDKMEDTINITSDKRVETSSLDVTRKDVGAPKAPPSPPLKRSTRRNKPPEEPLVELKGLEKGSKKGNNKEHIVQLDGSNDGRSISPLLEENNAHRIMSNNDAQRSGLVTKGQKVIADIPNHEFKCELCDKSYDLKWKLGTHVRYDHTCELCGEYYRSESEFEEHITQIHNEDISDYIWIECGCPSCDERFTSGHDLVNHVITDHKDWYANLKSGKWAYDPMVKM